MKLLSRDKLAGALTTILILFSAFVVISILLLCIGVSPLSTFGALFKGAFGSKLGLINTIQKAVPICLCALGVAVAKQAGIFNIGINGQMIIGSIASVITAVYIKGLPTAIHVPLCLIAGMLGGALYALIPTLGYLWRRLNILVLCLLMNTMAVKIETWLIYAYFKDPNALTNSTYRIQASSNLPNLVRTPARLNIGFIIALIVSAIMYIYFYKTTSGFELRAVGLNNNGAKYAGINTKKYISSSLLIGGALAGLAGAIEVLGTYYRLYVGFSPAYGFDGIPISLLSGNNPIGIIIGSIVFGALRVGSSTMQVKVGVSSELVDVIQGVLICFIALEYLFKFASNKLLGKIHHKEAANVKSI